MKRSAIAMGIFLAGALGAASAAWAHHSFAQFDADQKVIVDGRVVTWSYTNPHSWLFIEGLDEKGEMQKWSFEGAAPIHAARQGVTGNTFKVGEKVRVVMSPLRDGRRAGAMCFVVKEDASIAQPNDSVCNANEVIARWKAKGWLENGKHLEAHPTTE